MGDLARVDINLYIGSRDDASDTETLQQKEVTHILTIDVKPLPTTQQMTFQCKFIHALDDPETDLLSYFEECIQFIEDGVKMGGVLVHCAAGVSRSATITAAYLMRKHNIGVEEALGKIEEKRHVGPNPGFMQQLHLFEEMGSRLDQKHPKYKIYFWNKLSARVQAARSLEDINADTLEPDPSVGGTGGETVYRCKKCRRILFKQTSFLSHSEGTGEAAFDWRRDSIKHDGSHSSSDEKETMCSQSYFIEPVQWMSDCISSLEGKLSCPKCNAKLGSFNWAGERCPCGAWITPAFHIQIQKVDKSSPRSLPVTVPPQCRTTANQTTLT
ncbi:dual specificity protein phosphatase 12 [Lingula anatina]|uniref:Dual specificity protein phosphatase 12 n=1 Tax=Lingula anatina TaxID=7574 RepID=A0A1S3JIV5_LINAN|nr:dual specificity protein phosphatase 12 [Lingula anatina]|eukprot:XP_013410303.1 dual specificity protein phosphatase 12 [Lingula anatina]